MNPPSKPSVPVPPRPARATGVEHSPDAVNIDLGLVVLDPDQPRKEFDEAKMEAMIESLRTHGQLQPVRVRWDEAEGLYILLVGERRYRAMIAAGFDTIAAIIHDKPLTPAEALEIQLVENLVRDELKPIELANAIRRLMTLSGLNQARVATRIGLSPASVSQALALLDLDPEVRGRVDAGTLTPRAAVLIGRAGSAEAQREVARATEAGSLSIADVAEAVKERKGRGQAPRPSKAKAKAPKLPTKWRHRDKPSGYGLTVERVKGIDPRSLATFLRAAADRAEGEVEAGGKNEDEAAA